MRVMTTKETAKYLRLNPEKLREIARRGDIPHKRIGDSPNARYLFVREVLDAWLTQNKEKKDEKSNC